MKRIPRPLDPVELRVLGALLEKEQTTPDHYPLTENALRAACNQKSNRSPLVALTETEVADALDRLFVDVLVWQTTGARVAKWEQNTKRRWALAPGPKAVITELLIRGPQTVGELKARCARMHPFASTDELEAALREMAEGPEPLVTRLTRWPGQKWSRWAHLVGGPVEDQPPPSPVGATASATPPVTAPRRHEPGLADRVDQLVLRVETLEKELAGLKTELGIETPVVEIQSEEEE